MNFQRVGRFGPPLAAIPPSSVEGADVLKRILVGLLMLGALGAAADKFTGRGTWETTLLPRDYDNDGTVDAYYDTDQNLTWLADWGLFGGFQPDARRWAARLRVGGDRFWRLPLTNHDFLHLPGPPNPAEGELEHLFFVTLGNYRRCDPSISIYCTLDYNLTDVPNTGPFLRVDEMIGLGNPPPQGIVKDMPIEFTNWPFFSFRLGVAGLDSLVAYQFVAVHKGDVGVPEPPIAGLGLLAAAALGVAARRRRSGSISR